MMCRCCSKAIDGKTLKQYADMPFHDGCMNTEMKIVYKKVTYPELEELEEYYSEIYGVSRTGAFFMIVENSKARCRRDLAEAREYAKEMKRYSEMTQEELLAEINNKN